MSTQETSPQEKKSRRWSLDTWAVILALAAALLVRAGIIKHIPW